MQPTDCNTHAAQCQSLPRSRINDTASEAISAGVSVSQRLLVLLASGLIAVTGPVILNTVTQASLVSIHILLEFGHFGLVAFQIFGS